MQFSVIASIDLPGNTPIKEFALRKPWRMTEGDEQYDMDYLADGDETDPWFKGKHRKYAACVTRQGWEKLYSKWGLYFNTEDTMGMLGAELPDGLYHGALPAISYSTKKSHVNISVYVCPLPGMGDPGHPDREGAWEETVTWMKATYP